MPPAVIDPFPSEIEVLRARRRSVELRLEEGRLLARVPHRMAKREVEALLPQLRAQLWRRLSRARVFDQDALERCARKVADERLSDLTLPAYRIRFSRRQHRRWGSCTRDPAAEASSIRISERLRGHPVWLLEHLVLHELIHLLVPDHGPRFHRLMARCPHGERAEGYLEALEGLSLLGEELPHGEALLERLRVGLRAQPGAGVVEDVELAAEAMDDLPLFRPAQRRL